MKDGLLLKAIIDTAIDGIITIDQFGIIETMNPAALKLFEYKEEDVIGKNISTLMPAPHKSNHDAYIHHYITTGEKKIIGIGREVMGQKRSGKLFPFRLSVSEVKLGTRTIFTGIVHDLTEQKEAENQLKHYTDELENIVASRTRTLNEVVKKLELGREETHRALEKEKELNHLKTRFVSTASHEFRTPLSSIKLSASLIDKYAKQKECDNIQKHTHKIKQSVNYLTDILNDFLSADKLEEGRVHNMPTEFDLVEFAQTLKEEMQGIARPGQFIVHQHTGTTSNVILDEHLLKNCVVNLISNSIKYSPENSIIEFNTKIDDDYIYISVKDNGIGIPESDQKNLFEPFFRANNAGNVQGTGLGLNLVTKYINLMNGSIEFTSQLNKGTKFRLKFSK